VHIRLIAVGDRQPGWVGDACKIYTGRFPPQWKFRIDQLATARRSRSGAAADAKQTESEQILARLAAGERLVLLDERGKQMNSSTLAARLADWQNEGRDVCFAIGGPDGVSEECRLRADFVWSLSELTLPHGLARVLLTEQLYRAWSLLSGHPYHRE
jgi:23S rRNA (pseudouridine1915-N3)-methyltransferase